MSNPEPSATDPVAHDGPSVSDLLAELERLRVDNARLREAATQARLAHNRLQTVLDTIPAGVAILDANGTVIRVNEVYSRIWRGSNPSPPVPGSVEETAAYVAWWADSGKLIGPRDWASSRALKGITSIGEFIEIQRFDGTRGTIINSAAPLYDDSGKCDGAVVALLDISERKRAEDDLRASEERYRSLFDCMSEGFALHEVVCDERGEPCDYRFLDVNPAFERLTGLKRDQVVGRLKTELLPEDDALWIRIYGKVALTGEPIHFDSRSSALGRHYDVFCFRPAPMQFAVVFVDVTEHKRLEQDLRDADRRKNEFLAALSHELRNPLAPIRTSLRVLDHVPQGSPQYERARTIMGRQVEQLTRLVDDLLDVTRVTRGRIELRPIRLELGQLLREATDDMRSLFEERHIALELQLPKDDAWVLGDRTRLAQVVGNLLHNASRFTPRGGRTRVELKVKRDQSVAEFSVSDNGCGITSDLLPLLFEPFTQMDHSLDRAQGGLGLGLALVHGLVELHGGSIVAHSDGAGYGATFTGTWCAPRQRRGHRKSRCYAPGTPPAPGTVPCPRSPNRAASRWRMWS